MILLSIIFPGISFLIRGKIGSFLLCILLQMTLIGWIPCSIWAVSSLVNERQDKRFKQLAKDINGIK